MPNTGKFQSKDQKAILRNSYTYAIVRSDSDPKRKQYRTGTTGKHCRIPEEAIIPDEELTFTINSIRASAKNGIFMQFSN